MQAVEIGLDTNTHNNIALSFTDRTYGLILVGQTGFGKTSLMEHLIAEDMRYQATAIVFDPHGELSERLLRIGGAIRLSNLLFCEITGNMSYGFNPLEVRTQGDPLEESQTIDSLMQVFRKHWSNNPGYSFGPRVEWVLSNTARTILANPGYTLAEIPLLLHDKAFRDKLVRNVTNPQVQFFWGEYRQLEATRRPIDVWQMVESTVTRLTQFLANEWLYRVLYQAKGTIKFHELIESGKTIIFSLPIGKLGEEPAALLGSLLLGKLVTTVFGRNEYGKTYRRLHIYIDEYSRFATPITSALLTQGRKFNVGTTITLQTLAQIPDEENRAAILQTGNLLAFQCIGSDADIIAKQMPLPDPVGLMKPEPVLLYSQTPVEDIWHKGHPNKEMQEFRDKFFWIVGEVENNPRADFYRYDWQSRALPHSPGFEAFLDWEWYRSSTDMLKRGLALWNTYLVQWMNHEYSGKPIGVSEMVDLLFSIIEYLSGAMGIRPTMQPYLSEPNREYLLRRMQDQVWREGEKYHLINPRTGEKDYKLRELEEVVKLEAIFPILYPSVIEANRSFAQTAGVSPYEFEHMIDWRLRPLSDEETGALKELLRQTIRTQNFEHIQPAFDKYCAVMTVLGWGLLTNEKDLEHKTHTQLDKYGGIANLRAKAQASDLMLFVSMACLMTGYLLEKEPVFDTSHSYKEVEYNRRTYSDLREELVTKLVSLPPYNAICTLAGKSGELPIQILTPQPLPISSDAEPKAQAVREESRKTLGHPWQEVVKDIQTRQNLPPAKPHIPN